MKIFLLFFTWLSGPIWACNDLEDARKVEFEVPFRLVEDVARMKEGMNAQQQKQLDDVLTKLPPYRWWWEALHFGSLRHGLKPLAKSELIDLFRFMGEADLDALFRKAASGNQELNRLEKQAVVLIFAQNWSVGAKLDRLYGAKSFLRNLRPSQMIESLLADGQGIRVQNMPIETLMLGLGARQGKVWDVIRRRHGILQFPEIAIESPYLSSIIQGLDDRVHSLKAAVHYETGWKKAHFQDQLDHAIFYRDMLREGRESFQQKAGEFLKKKSRFHQLLKMTFVGVPKLTADLAAGVALYLLVSVVGVPAAIDAFYNPNHARKSLSVDAEIVTVRHEVSDIQRLQGDLETLMDRFEDGDISAREYQKARQLIQGQIEEKKR